MISALAIGSIVYLGLELTQQRLDARFTKEDYEARIAALEADLAAAEATHSLKPKIPESIKKSSWWPF